MTAEQIEDFEKAMGPVTENNILPKLRTYREFLATPFAEKLAVTVSYKPADVFKVAGDPGFEMVSPTWWEVTAAKKATFAGHVPAKDLAAAYHTAFKAVGITAENCPQIIASGSKVLIADATMQSLCSALAATAIAGEPDKRDVFVQSVLKSIGVIKEAGRG